MRKYEVMLLFQPTLDKDMLFQEMSEAEKQLGGTIIRKDEWGLRKLAYPISKFLEAYYVIYYIETEPVNIIEFKKMLTIKKEIIRNMIIKHEKKWPFEMKTTKDLVFQNRRQNINKKQYSEQSEKVEEDKSDK
ncbi:MAG: hypothetical protein HPAVJP_0210 [Candidatus Hepatoplasma vulgare]|nr:MAG: hypothetical protein HPAVJP_0210 [Candidatus Hepatoplasma sp.]